MQIRPDIVVVAKDWNVEIYTIPAVVGAFAKSTARRSAPEALYPVQSLKYPGDAMLWQVGLLRSPVAAAAASSDPTSQEPILLGAYVQHGFARWSLEEDDTKQYRYTNDATPRRYSHDLYKIRVVWGQSGDRIAYIGRRAGTSVQIGGIISPGPADSETMRVWPNMDELYLRWEPAIDIGEFSWTCAFDECAGLIAAAMTSGRVVVVDSLSLWTPCTCGELPLSYRWSVTEIKLGRVDIAWDL